MEMIFPRLLVSRCHDNCFLAANLMISAARSVRCLRSHVLIRSIAMVKAGPCRGACSMYGRGWEAVEYSGVSDCFDLLEVECNL